MNIKVAPMKYHLPARTAGALLRKAADLIDERAKERDVAAERSMGKTVEMFNILTGQQLAESDGWLFMVLLKLVRSRIGSLQPDDLLDAMSYCALSLENQLLIQRLQEAQADADVEEIYA